jgi:hypothetical protein
MRRQSRWRPRDGVDAAQALGPTAVGLPPLRARGAGNTTSATATTLVRQPRVVVWAVGDPSAAELAPGRLRE